MMLSQYGVQSTMTVLINTDVLTTDNSVWLYTMTGKISI